MDATAKSVRLRSAISLGIATLIVVAVIITVGFGLYFGLVLNANNNVNPGGTAISSTQTTTTNTSENYPTNANTTNSTLGLELVLSTDAASIANGQTLNVSFSVMNAQPNENNVSKASDWKLPAFENVTDTLFQCIGWGNLLIYRGYYTQGNLSSGANYNLPLFQPAVHDNCTVFDFSLYSFQPSSSNALVYYSGGGPVTSSYGTIELTRGALVTGYYTPYQSYHILNKFVSPTPFPTGIYTIVAGDQWGQLVILHFTVQPNPMTTTTYSTSNSSTFLQNSSTQTPSSEETFNYATMPRSFQLGDYSFEMIYNGTGYEYSANGTGYMNMGFNLVLNVTSLQSGSSATVDFGWAPPAPESYSLPTPSTASLFNGAVQMNWNSNTTGSSGTFLTVWIFSNVPNPSTSNSTSTITAACSTTTTTFVNATVTQTATECVQ